MKILQIFTIVLIFFMHSQLSAYLSKKYSDAMYGGQYISVINSNILDITNKRFPMACHGACKFSSRSVRKKTRGKQNQLWSIRKIDYFSRIKNSHQNNLFRSKVLLSMPSKQVIKSNAAVPTVSFNGAWSYLNSVTKKSYAYLTTKLGFTKDSKMRAQPFIPVYQKKKRNRVGFKGVFGKNYFPRRSNVVVSSIRPIMHERIKLDRLLEELKRRPDFGQTGLQHVINILDIEFFIIESLLAGDSRFKVQEMVEERNKLLQTSSPIVVHVYNMIINVVTIDRTVETKMKLYDDVDMQKKSALSVDEKKAFLHKMKNVLQAYYGKIRRMQYDIYFVIT